MENAYIQMITDFQKRVAAFEEEQEKKGLTRMEYMYSEEVSAMFLDYIKTIHENIEKDTTGTGFIFDMFVRELQEHDYEETMDVTSVLDSVGLTETDLEKPNIKHGLELAIAHIMQI